MKKILGLLIGVFAAILFFSLFSLVSYYLGINEGQEQYDELAQLVQDAPMPGKIVMHDFYLAVICKLFDGTIIYDPVAYMGYRQHGKNVVGVSRSKTAALRNRIRSLTKKAAVTIAEQMQSVLDAYPLLPDNAQRRWLKQLAAMSSSLPARFSVACAGKTQYISLEKSLTLRLAILLGNR